MNSSAPASRAAARTAPSVAPGRASRMLSATLPWNRCGRCGTQATCARQAAGVDGGEVRVADQDAARIGLDEPEQQARDGRLAGAADADQRGQAPGRDREVEGPDRRLGPARVRERDVPEGDREAGRPGPAPAGSPPPRPGRRRSRARRHARSRRQRLVEDGERARGDGATRGPRVVARGKLAQGQEELGHDDEHRQRPVEGDGTVHQSQADLDRDERDRDGAAPLQHERGLERGPQDLHRRVAVLAADRPDRVDLLAAPAEHLERGKAAQHVEEERAEPADLGEPPLGDRARPATDVRPAAGRGSGR